MKSLTLIIVAVLIAAFSGSPEVLAQQKQHHQGKRQGMQMMQGGCPMQGMQMNELRSSDIFSKGRIAFLKAELEITDAQKKLFERYAESVTANLSHMQNMRRNMHNMMQAENPVERLEIHISMMESRLDTLKEMQQPMEALFATFTDAQKEKASLLMPGITCMR